ncbi:MAG: hypothetical protein QOE58_422, partial [Actinomycetota bacterium]|nr:hypothetical protein [Actinomycetota bacterium]
RLYTYGTDGSSWLAAYNLDSFAPLGAGMAVSGPVTAASTQGDGTLFLAIGGTAPRLDRYGVNSAGVERTASIPLPTLTGRTVDAIYRQPGSPYVWLLSAVAGIGDPNVPGLTVTQVDLRRIGASDPWDWDSPPAPASCTAPVHESANTFPNTALGYSNGALWFGCASPHYPLIGAPPPTAPPPTTRGIGRLPLTNASGKLTYGTFEAFSIPTDVAGGNAFFDPGSGRIVIVGASPATSGAAGFVFDTRSQRFVGSVALHGDAPSGYAMGLNPVSGRFYALAPNGLTGADIRANPPHQGYRVESLAKDPDGAHPLSTPRAVLGIPTDAATSRMFLAYQVGSKHIYVIKDSAVPYVDPDPPDIDVNTTDIDEVPGKTEATYAAAVQGYGASYRWVGGVQSQIVNSITFNTSSIPVTSGTREVRTAYLQRLTFANSEAAAGAITAMPDEGDTPADLAKTQPRNPSNGEAVLIPDVKDPANKDRQTAIGPIVNWPYSAANCSDFGEKSQQQTATDTEVACDAGANASAHALTRSTDANVISVGKAEFTGRSYRDSGLGVVSSATSIARGVSVLDGALQIGEVRAVAQSSAKGRKGQAKATWSYSLSDVFVKGVRVCTQQCDPAAVASAVNSGLGGRVRMYFPQPLVSATPGGYQAVVRRDAYDQLEEILFNEQRADRVEVPALIISIYQDNLKPGRVVAQLAAVAVEATYGITSTDFDGGNIDRNQGLVGALADSLDSPIFGGSADVSATGGAGFGGGPPRPQSVGPSGSNPLTNPGRLLLNGIRAAGALLPVWAVLLIPIYLSARRWLLLQRAQLSTRGSA